MSPFGLYHKLVIIWSNKTCLLVDDKNRYRLLIISHFKSTLYLKFLMNAFNLFIFGSNFHFISFQRHII